METTKEKDKAFFAAVGLICVAVAGLVFTESDSKAVEQRHYCEMVSLWEADAAIGVKENDRAGWPNYKNVECGEWISNM